MKLGGVLPILQTLAAACALVSAQRVRGAEAATKHTTHATLNITQQMEALANGSPSVNATDVDVTSGWAAFPHDVNSTRLVPSSGHHGNRTGRDKDKKPFLGGRHNESIPALGEFKRSVALLLHSTEDETEQLQGCITVPIAPRFFLTRASCVRDADDAKFLFVETSGKSSHCDRLPVRIKTTTSHENPSVNLAIIEVEDQATKAGLNYATMLQPMPLSDFEPTYYDREDLLSLVSIDNIFNPSLAKNPRSIEKLIRVSPSSCQYGSSDDIAKCYVPAELSSRELSFEFGQGMLMYDKKALVGLPDCDGLCSGGMFYSATHLATFREWIDETTHSGTKWIESKKNNARRKQTVTIEKEPSYVSLFTSQSPEAEKVCGGSLIAPRFVLTTASCVANQTITTARVGHGERTISKSSQEDVIPVRNVSVHPQFANTTKFSNDLAVIELAGPTFYMPTILASSDTLNTDHVAAVGTGQPRRSSFDSSLMCLPPQTSSETLNARALQSTENVSEDESALNPDDFVSFSLDELDLDVPTPQESELSTVEQWNKDAGDGVLEVPKEASYYLLGVSLGLPDSTIQIGNHSESRLCSLNETVGDDDDSSLVVRLATLETIEFINAVSVDHTWNNPHEVPFESAKFMIMDTSFKAAKFGAFNVNDSYDGPLEFETPPSDADLGFVVGLRLDREGQNYCGGSLIAPSYVLTAAHCVGGDRAKFVSVGSRDSAGAEAELIAVKSSNVITHPLYGKRSRFSYDVAVLELESQAYPKPITLDNSYELNPSMYMTLYGYGTDSASSSVLSPVLRSVDLPFFPRDKCFVKFPELDESMFCAGGELARDACTGDSGSPLVRIVQGKPLLVGLVSSGRNGCGTPGTPGVYTFVAEMQSFIDKVVAGNKWVTNAKPSSIKTTSVAGPPDSSAPADNEDRASSADADSPVLRSGVVNMTDLPFEIINMANGSMEHQLSIVEMAKDTPSRLQVAVMEFLVGDYEYISGWSPKMDQVWTMSFYSTGDLTGLMKIIAQHKAKALYSRKSRFVRPAKTSQRESDDRALLSRASCSDGH